MGRSEKTRRLPSFNDLETDLRQTTDLYHQFPEVVKEMEAILKTYWPKS